jgi:hypothetical protein
MNEPKQRRQPKKTRKRRAQALLNAIEKQSYWEQAI